MIVDVGRRIIFAAIHLRRVRGLWGRCGSRSVQVTPVAVYTKPTRLYRYRLSWNLQLDATLSTADVAVGMQIDWRGRQVYSKGISWKKPMRTIKPVDDARLATGEYAAGARSISNFSFMEMVGVEIYGGLERRFPLADHPQAVRRRGRRRVGYRYRRGKY